MSRKTAAKDGSLERRHFDTSQWNDRPDCLLLLKDEKTIQRPSVDFTERSTSVALYVSYVIISLMLLLMQYVCYKQWMDADGCPAVSEVVSSGELMLNE